MNIERFMKAVKYDFPDEIPVSCGILPAAWMFYGQELVDLALKYPDIISFVPDLNNIPIPDTYRMGEHVDEWGCVWNNLYEGMEAIVTGHPLPNRADIHNLEIPNNIDGRLPHGFMYLRLLDLRGFEEIMFDFADECEEIQILIDKVVEYNCRQVGVVLPRYSKGDMMTFGDDLGMQHGLAIGVDKWRKYMKPAFSKIYAPVKAKGCYIYMHTDGRIVDIMQDIVDCGADIINPQYSANGLDDLERVCKGKIPIDLDLDRQFFPVATPAQIDEHVRECVERLYLPQGGLAIKAELNYEVPLENFEAVFTALRKYRTWK